MRTIKTYSKRAPFYNAFIRTYSNCDGVESFQSGCMSVLPAGESKMQRQVEVLFASTILILFALAACGTRSTQGDDKMAAIDVVMAHERAVQEFDFDKMD